MESQSIDSDQSQQKKKKIIAEGCFKYREEVTFSEECFRINDGMMLQMRRRNVIERRTLQKCADWNFLSNNMLSFGGCKLLLVVSEGTGHTAFT
jgi:hypothetical protein